MTLQELNTTFNLNISENLNERQSAGCYISGVIYISLDLKKYTGVRANRPNNYGQKLYPNVMSYASEDLRSVCIAHEFGHAIEDYNRSCPVFRSTRDLCDRLAPRYVSVYSGNRHPMSNYSEAFAEVFALYITNPGLLQSISLELFHSMNDFYVSFL